MKKELFILLLVTIFIACKSDKKNENLTTNNTESVKPEKEKETESEKFEKSILDFRKINQYLADDYPVEGFGMQKFNDSTFAFVFKLGQNVTNNIVKKYSIGIKGYYQLEDEPFTKSASPDLTKVGNGNYVVIKRKIKNIKYFDSIDVYSYARNNWKSSGRISGFKVKDILFE